MYDEYDVETAVYKYQEVPGVNLENPSPKDYEKLAKFIADTAIARIPRENYEITRRFIELMYEHWCQRTNFGQDPETLRKDNIETLLRDFQLEMDALFGMLENGNWEDYAHVYIRPPIDGTTIRLQFRKADEGQLCCLDV